MSKRLIDLAGSTMGLLLLSPLLIIAAVSIRFTMGGPLLFRQGRCGLRGHSFQVYKLRTMSGQSDEFGALLPDARRLTPLGRFLRRYSIDELPQLWNVLRGEMSLVGPRPLMASYFERCDTRQIRRYQVKPGLTGWAQVNGRNALTWDEKFALDIWYVDHRSVRLDLRIIGLTLLGLMRGHGISQAGHATMPEFMGSAHEP